MENLTNESESEDTVPLPKQIFKRQASTSIPGFDVSLNESNTRNAQFDKSDTSPTISAPKKSSLFEKARELPQNNFSVNFEESNINSETESSITVNFLKPKLPFKRKVTNDTSKIKTNQFDVGFNETNADVSDRSILDDINKDIDDDSADSITLTTKSNPFKKPKQQSKNVFNIDFDETNNDNSALSTSLTKVVFKKPVEKPLDQFQVSFSETNNDLVSDATDKTQNKLSQDDLTAEKVFAKPSNENLRDAFNVEYEESDFGENSEVTSTLTSSKCLFKVPRPSSQNFEVSFSPTMPQITSTSSQEQNSRTESINNSDSEINDTEDKSDSTTVDSSSESVTDNQKSRSKSVINSDSELNDGEESCHVNSVDTSNNNDREMQEENDDIITEVRKEEQEKGTPREKRVELEILNRSNKSDMYLDQSSINDENLNNWMSDYSDEEIQPPTVPTIPKNTSFTEEGPQAVKPVSPTQTCTMTWEQKFNEIVSNSKKRTQLQESNLLNLGKVSKTQDMSKPKPNKEQRHEKINKAKPPKLIKPAHFATKRLYQYIIRKLEPKYGIDTLLQSEQIVSSICETVKKVERRKTHQKKLIQDLKKEMASVGLIETTVDFYEFVIKFLPDSFRVKVIPCVQPVTNTVFPPKDTVNPFDKIL